MLIGLRYTKDRGNSLLYFRIRNVINKFYNFALNTWDDLDAGADTRKYLSELPDLDTVESLYTANVPMVVGIHIKEVVDLTDNSIVGMDISNDEEANNNAIISSLSNIEYDINNLKSDIDLITDMQMGNWEIINNQMILYDRNSVEIMRFNLLDKFGNPSENNVFKRVRTT